MSYIGFCQIHELLNEANTIFKINLAGFLLFNKTLLILSYESFSFAVSKLSNKL